MDFWQQVVLASEVSLHTKIYSLSLEMVKVLEGIQAQQVPQQCFEAM